MPRSAYAISLRAIVAVSVAASFLAVSFVWGEEPAAPETVSAESNADRGEATTAHAFELEDQHRKKHAFTVPPKRVAILLFADREGAKQLDAWIKALRERYESTADLHGVAELSIVPPFAQGVARTMFRRKFKYPVMLDWDGSISKKFGYVKGVANVFVVDTEGQIRAHTTGEANPESIEAVDAVMAELLPSAQPLDTSAGANPETAAP